MKLLLLFVCVYVVRCNAGYEYGRSSYYAGVDDEPSPTGVQNAPVPIKPSKPTNDIPVAPTQMPRRPIPKPPKRPVQPAKNDGKSADSLTKPAVKPIPAWLYPDCPGGRVDKRGDETFCCLRCMQDTCKKMQLKQKDASAPVCKGNIVGCSSMDLCCEGVGNEMTCTTMPRHSTDDPKKPCCGGKPVADFGHDTPKEPTTVEKKPQGICTNGRILECGPLKFCCIGSGTSETCNIVPKA